MMRDYWGRDGQRIHTSIWETLRWQDSYVFVARNIVVSTQDTSNTLDVSTVWRGFDPDQHPWPVVPAPAPLSIFETAVLRGKPGGQSLIIANWDADTETDAREQHAESVTWACGIIDAPATIIRIPVVPARPRDGWRVQLRRRMRGTCQVCRHRDRVAPGGQLTTHGNPTCRGSGLPPAVGTETLGARLRIVPDLTAP